MTKSIPTRRGRWGEKRADLGLAAPCDGERSWQLDGERLQPFGPPSSEHDLCPSYTQKLWMRVKKKAAYLPG
jgi:hypothetical protein